MTSKRSEHYQIPQQTFAWNKLRMDYDWAFCDGAIDAPEWIPTGSTKNMDFNHATEADGTGGIPVQCGLVTRDHFVPTMPRHQPEEPPIAPKRGRKPLHGEAMTPAQRKAKERSARQILLQAARDELDVLRVRLQIQAGRANTAALRNELLDISEELREVWTRLAEVK